MTITDYLIGTVDVEREYVRPYRRAGKTVKGYGWMRGRYLCEREGT